MSQFVGFISTSLDDPVLTNKIGTLVCEIIFIIFWITEAWHVVLAYLLSASNRHFHFDTRLIILLNTLNLLFKDLDKSEISKKPTKKGEKKRISGCISNWINYFKFQDNLV